MPLALPRAMRPGRLLALLFAAFLAQATWTVVTGMRDDVRPADVAVVLGTTANPDGTLSDRLQARTAAGLELYRAGQVRRILVSGATGPEGVNEAEAMAGWLERQGVPPKDVLVDPDGWNTWETARNTRAILEREGLSTVVAVTSYYHVPRTRRALEAAGVDVVGTHHARLMWEPRELWSIAREVPATWAYVLRDRA